MFIFEIIKRTNKASRYIFLDSKWVSLFSNGSWVIIFINGKNVGFKPRDYDYEIRMILSRVVQRTSDLWLCIVD